MGTGEELFQKDRRGMGVPALHSPLYQGRISCMYVLGTEKGSSTVLPCTVPSLRGVAPVRRAGAGEGLP